MEGGRWHSGRSRGVNCLRRECWLSKSGHISKFSFLPSHGRIKAWFIPRAWRWPELPSDKQPDTSFYGSLWAVCHLALLSSFPVSHPFAFFSLSGDCTCEWPSALHPCPRLCSLQTQVTARIPSHTDLMSFLRTGGFNGQFEFKQQQQKRKPQNYKHNALCID